MPGGSIVDGSVSVVGSVGVVSSADVVGTFTVLVSFAENNVSHIGCVVDTSCNFVKVCCFKQWCWF